MATLARRLLLAPRSVTLRRSGRAGASHASTKLISMPLAVSCANLGNAIAARKLRRRSHRRTPAPNPPITRMQACSCWRGAVALQPGESVQGGDAAGPGARHGSHAARDVHPRAGRIAQRPHWCRTKRPRHARCVWQWTESQLIWAGRMVPFKPPQRLPTAAHKFEFMEDANVDEVSC